jgi:hypothetical protein
MKTMNFERRAPPMMDATSSKDFSSRRRRRPLLRRMHRGMHLWIYESQQF